LNDRALGEARRRQGIAVGELHGLLSTPVKALHGGVRGQPACHRQLRQRCKLERDRIADENRARRNRCLFLARKMQAARRRASVSRSDLDFTEPHRLPAIAVRKDQADALSARAQADSLPQRLFVQ